MDALLVMAVVGLFVLAFWRVGWWRWFWLGLAVYLGVFELVAKQVTGRTISQQFWLWHATDPVYGWLLVVLVALGGVGLAVHLGWKAWRRRNPSP